MSLEIPSIIAWVLIGLAAGYLASLIMGSKRGLISSLLLGLGGVGDDLDGSRGGGAFAHRRAVNPSNWARRSSRLNRSSIWAGVIKSSPNHG